LLVVEGSSTSLFLNLIWNLEESIGANKANSKKK
jgi:hypothetical protein